MNNYDTENKYNIDWTVSKAKSNTLYYISDTIDNWYILIKNPKNETIFIGYHINKKRNWPYTNHIKTTNKPKQKKNIVYINEKEINKYINSNRKSDNYQSIFANCSFYVVPESKKIILFEIDPVLYQYVDDKETHMYESTFANEINDKIYFEGAYISVRVNKYERDVTAKKACLKYYGTQCRICGFKFSNKYGKEFENKIHVHHKKPLSEIGKKYQVDPINDLIPVCPNCHMILHSKGNNQAYSIEEVKEMINNNL